MNDKDSQRYRANLQGEIDGAAVYRALGDSESDPKLAEVFRRLASVEEAHAEFWRSRLGDKARTLSPSLHARLLAWTARRFGPGFVIPTLAATEARDRRAYDGQVEAQGTSLPADERSHARIMSEIAKIASR